MKKTILLLACLLSINLCSCIEYTKTELSLSNYLNYFEILSLNSGSIKSLNPETCSLEAPKDVGMDVTTTHLSANFHPKSEKLWNANFEDVKFTFKINLYYGKSTISDVDTPDHVIDFTSHLHYYTNESKEYYNVGFSLTYYKMAYYVANDKVDYYEISFLKDDYENTKSKGSNYYRQIKLIDVSGTVGSYS